ncbi:DNA topoisomerase I [Prochlorococcus sp. MIT 0602]|nr:DNA topoisomerase I [Prochlorococcus sp. MIT 0602]KGG16999.1 DNA topoisomerase I [Prochlorococcus sp. MIT 0603]
MPKDFQVIASMGHVRDLPKGASEIPAAMKKEKWSRIGVNTSEDFEPLYVVPKDKKKVVRELKSALKDAKELLLATDEDREGESISWHLLELLKPKIPTKRMVFHEITKQAITKALKEPRDLDMELVHAQETRRILDRLVGYTLSPLLWKKVAWGLSAGRVQSVSVRLLVKRERERRAFKSASYWDLKVQLQKNKSVLEARLMTVADQKIAKGSDFDEKTGKLKTGSKANLLNEADAKALAQALGTQKWKVLSVDKKPTVRKPVPPFTTSTLQQDANRKLRLSARETMRCAQGLYERGFITYMRTDSVNLSQQAISAARKCVELRYGKEYLSESPRRFVSKARNAQEAHEAIRPAGETFKTPSESNLTGRDLALYELIWKRTIASQMAEARLTMMSVDISVRETVFRASGKNIDFPGFFRAYVEGSDDPEAALEGQEVLLPPLAVGDDLIPKTLDVIGHETKPPARYSEASLVKTLEKEGIGRPSTYASIIGTIVDRGYASLNSNSLAPTFTAFAVTSLLEEHFPDLVDTTFTARMESSLDEISSGSIQWLPYLESFYKGRKGLAAQVDKREGDIDGKAYRKVDLEGIPCTVRIGSNGPWLEGKRINENGEEVDAKGNLPIDITPGDLDVDKVKQILDGPSDLGIHPETGEKVYLRFGPWGPFLQLGEAVEKKDKPRRASLPKDVRTEEISLDYAVKLLSLPRILGEHPDGGIVEARTGQFGPYVVWDKGDGEKPDNRSLKKEDDVYEISLRRALELLSIPKLGRGGRMALKDLGKPKGEKENVHIYNGPYGLYVKQGKTNASLPKGTEVDEVTIEVAIKLLEAKKSTGSKPRTKKTSKKSITKGKTSSKTKKSNLTVQSLKNKTKK